MTRPEESDSLKIPAVPRSERDAPPSAKPSAKPSAAGRARVREPSAASVVSAASLLAALTTVAACLSFHPGPLPDEPESAAFVELADTRVHYVDLRPAEVPEVGTVVLVHGFGATSASWLVLAPDLLEQGYRVVALDLKGHGWSSRSEGDYSIAAQAGLVLDLLDHLGVEEFAIAGHSWGSAISLQVALDAPARVSRVVLAAGMFFDDQRPTMFGWVRTPVVGEVIMGAFYTERQDERMALALYEPERHITEEVVEQLDALMARPGTKAAALAAIRAMDFSELERRYADIEQPVLLIWGREDHVTPIEWGERLFNELRDAELVTVPRCGHVPMVEAPPVTTRAMLSFLSEGSG